SSAPTPRTAGTRTGRIVREGATANREISDVVADGDGAAGGGTADPAGTADPVGREGDAAIAASAAGTADDLIASPLENSAEGAGGHVQVRHRVINGASRGGTCGAPHGAVAIGTINEANTARTAVAARHQRGREGRTRYRQGVSVIGYGAAGGDAGVAADTAGTTDAAGTVDTRKRARTGVAAIAAVEAAATDAASTAGRAIADAEVVRDELAVRHGHRTHIGIHPATLTGA